MDYIVNDLDVQWVEIGHQCYPTFTWNVLNLFYHYVDDIFTVWDDAWGSFDIFFQILNNFVPSMKFKVDWKSERKLPF